MALTLSCALDDGACVGLFGRGACAVVCLAVGSLQVWADLVRKVVARCFFMRAQHGTSVAAVTLEATRRRSGQVNSARLDVRLRASENIQCL